MGTAVSYARTGGRPPVDDERLEIDAGGGWRLWRTLGGPRAGAFGGRLAADRRRRLEAAIDAMTERAVPSASASAPASRPRPDAAREAFHAGARRLDVPAGTPVRGGWAPLVRLLRRSSDALASPAFADAALELRLDSGSAGAAHLVRLGPGSMRLYPASLHAEAYARAASEVIVDRVAAGAGIVPEDPRGDPVETGEGWVLPVALPRVPAVPPGGRLETWMWLDIEGPYGIVRVRLVAEVTGGPSPA